MTLQNRPIKSLKSIRGSALISNINDILTSFYGVGILGIFTFLAFAFSLELEFYTFVVLYTIYVGIFADDFTPLMPLFIFCYIAPSKANNPGLQTDGLFYGSTATYLVTIVAIAVVVLLVRIVFDKEMGARRLFTKKRALLPGMLVLGASYLLSGILHPQYAEYAKGNLTFAAIQFVSVILLYFIFSATVDWDYFDFEYIAFIGLVMGFVVSAEVGFIYFTGDIIQNGVIGDRYLIQTGWGCYNNIGAIISMSIPFAFYFASRKRGSTAFLAIACLLFIAVVFTGSRGSLVGAILAFGISFIYTFIKCENKREFRIASFVLFAVLVAGAWVAREKLAGIFQNIPNIFNNDGGSISVSDSGRLEYYKNGIQVYLKNPIFGQSFYPMEQDLCSFSVVPEFISFFPPRWHNTIIQMMASCGTVGILAYLYHRFSTVMLYCKKRTKNNTYLLFCLGTLLCMSLLDCHFFNVGPVLFYSTVLAVFEFALEKPKYPCRYL